MKSALYFFLGVIIGAAGGAYVAASIESKKADDRVEKATVEARNFYKEKYASESGDADTKLKEDDKKGYESITRIYGPQFDLYPSNRVPYGQPVIEGEDRKPDPNAETYAYEIDDDEFGMDREYTTYSLDYYSDGNLVDETGNIVEDPIRLVGSDILDELETRASNIAYVRNDITKTDYEICYINAPYEATGTEKD